MERGSRLVEMLPDMRVFTEISQELKAQKDILIPIRAFGMTLVLHALAVSGPRSAEPSGDLGVVQMPGKVQGASRDSRDRYYCGQIRGDSSGSHVWLTRPRSGLEIVGGCRGCSTLNGAWSAWRGTHGEIIVGLE